MNYLAWVLKFALFVLVLTFAIKNSDLVTVHYYFGEEWQATERGCAARRLSVAHRAHVPVRSTSRHRSRAGQRRHIDSLWTPGGNR